MAAGVHVIATPQMAAAQRDGAQLPRPWIGVVDLLRMVEGLADEPSEDRPLVVMGLEVLLALAAEDPAGVTSVVREALHGCKHYLEWKRIPLVFVVAGALRSGLTDDTAVLVTASQEFDLAAVFGRALQPREFVAEGGWWWTPQLG